MRYRGYSIKMTKEELYNIQVRSIDKMLYKKILQNWDNIAKPLNGLGDFEKITARIGAICGDEGINIAKKAVVMMCADNGVINEGVSQSGSDVTAVVAGLMGQGESSVCKMARVAGADTFPIDIGIKDAANISGVIDKKISCGTRNFADEPAMTETEVFEAISTGIDIVGDLKRKGYKILATGEMGIGNTTTSAALCAALLGVSGKVTAGRGAGLSDEGLKKKIKVIDDAIQKYDLYNSDPLYCLRCVGGLDIAGLCGCFIGGAVYDMPVIIDGVISATAAYTAEKILPGVKEYFIASHRGVESGISILLDKMNMEPVINGRLALGEGTGAVMLFPLLDMALSLYHDGMKFEDISIKQYERFIK